VLVWQLDWQLPVQSVPITTKVVSSNHGHGEVHDTTLCDKVCQWLATGRWFSPGTPVSFTNKTDHDDITEILLKVALSTININDKIATYDIYDTDFVASRLFRNSFNCRYNPRMDYAFCLLTLKSSKNGDYHYVVLHTSPIYILR
jgi:hypothetical protein